MLDVVGGVGHQIPGFGLIKVSYREGLDVGKESVSYPLFHPSGRSYETSTPDKAKYPDQ